jgi:hypothetical protein
MATPAHNEFSQFSVEAIARFLAVYGNENPTLICRSRVPPSVTAVKPIHASLPASLRPSCPLNDAADQSAYLEDLVSIAVTSARQAEDAARQIQSASMIAPRRMFAVAAFGATAIFIGIVGITGAQFGLDVPRLLADASSAFAAADRAQSAGRQALVGAQLPAVAMATAEPPAQASGESRRDTAISPPTSVVASTAFEGESTAQLPTSEAVSAIPGPPAAPQPPQATPQADPIMQAAAPSIDSQTGSWRRTRTDRRYDHRFVLINIIRDPALVLNHLGLGASRPPSSHSASGVLEGGARR